MTKPNCLNRTTVVNWPSTRPNMPFQSDAPEGSDAFRWQLLEEIALAGLADNMGQGKIAWYSHGTPEKCDLWAAWQLFPLDDDQTCHSKDSEWAIELLYNSVKTGSQLVLETRWWQDVVEKDNTQQGGPPISGWAALENKKNTTRMAIRVGVNILQFCSVSNSLSLATFQMKWEVYFFKDVFARLYYCVVIIVSSLWFCMHM